jgi:hypothetical protein
MYAAAVTNVAGERILPFSATIQPLVVAPLAGIAVLTCATLVNAGADLVVVFPFLAIRIAPFCYGAAVLFVVPILATWPPSRLPSYPIAVIWGILSAVASLATLAVLGFGGTPAAQSVQWLEAWSDVLTFIVAGAGSGLLYAYVVQRRCA